ncbi:hypothetical protein RJ639_003397 [Escallonia herrerae]|uniref:Uncharacterized protein n=1 Tax=Escallonia herrerae TaxID=1293975 RepID=A0AA88W3A8_9ASTE|nr:hypothetical protein RJ639_003397 [Escallonia herrerae]
MIYRKWSLLTGPAVILGGIVATFAVANYLFVQNDPFLKPRSRKQETVPEPNRRSKSSWKSSKRKRCSTEKSRDSYFDDSSGDSGSKKIKKARISAETLTGSKKISAWVSGLD